MKKTKRKDHYIPQGYLRGFIDPSRVGHPKPLWCLDIPTNTWSPRSTSEVGQYRGFYDYAGAKAAIAELEAADSVFVGLENGYPGIRDEIVSSGFAQWTKHREFFLRFMRMMGVRSPLFREQKTAEGKTMRALVVEEVYHDRKAIKVKSLTPSPVPPAFIRNRAITQMREEIQKGVAWLADFHWALRYTESVTDPFVISELPFAAEGPPGELKDVLTHPDTLLVFPLCWQACLFGSVRKFDVETDKFDTADMRTTRRKYKAWAGQFLLSPVKINEF
jgi:hypothetical protein